MRNVDSESYYCELKEFEYITNIDEYSSTTDSRYHPIDSFHFKEFDEFVRKQNDGGDSDALDFFKSYTAKGIGNVIQAKNYVGLVQLESGYQIQILPKIDMVDVIDEDITTSKVFIDMIKSMRDFPSKAFNQANLKTESMNIYEIFINMYVYQVSELVRRGLKSSYLRTEDNLNVYKGKLKINEHIKNNIAHAERFYVIYDEYSQNRPENKIIKATLLKLKKISRSSNNIKIIRQLLACFEEIEPSVNYDKDLSRIVIDRTTRDYEDIIIWSKVFLQNKSFSTFSGDNKARALLFPMEKLYESYVAQYVEDIMGAAGYDVLTQEADKYLFKEFTSKDENSITNVREVFALKPDIILKDSKNNTIIMDTKWKRLKNDPSHYYGISQADMYQMFAYSKKYNAKNVWLLYPIVDDMKDYESSIVFKDIDGDNDNTVIRVFFINVALISNSIDKLLIEIRKQFNELNNI